MSSRSSRVQSSDVQEILQGTGHTAARSSPAEHVASPSSPTTSVGPLERAASQNHGRTKSVATDITNGTAPRTNRFSMSFPVQPSPSMSPTRSSHSPVRDAHVSDSVISPTGPTDTNFLTAIAAQERRVLELKEELSKAETELNKLKEQWQQHEAQRKRNDARSLTKLQPVQSPLPMTDRDEDSDGSNAWMQQEMERRKALLSGSKSSNRRVFSGSKHTRTLSLLSPVNAATPSAPSSQRSPVRQTRKDSLPESARRSHESDARLTRPTTITRASTTPDLTVDGTSAAAAAAAAASELGDAGMDRDLLIQTGKKVATGLRDGLWTFWEDLRQATVGDEATQIPPPNDQTSSQTPRTAKKRTSKTSIRPSSRSSSPAKSFTDTKRPSPKRKHKKSATMSLASAPALAEPSFWTEHGLLPQNAAQTPAKKPSFSDPRHIDTPSKRSSDDAADNEAWDVWDESSPQGSCSSSAASVTATLPSTVSGPTSPRTSAEVSAARSGQKDDQSAGDTDVAKDKTLPQRASSKKDPIPWPALSTLGPKALRRTASHLMSEWEKSLTPSPTKEKSGQQDYLGLGAEAAAVWVPADQRMESG